MKAPMAFLLVRHAPKAAAEHQVNYAQIRQALEDGSLVIDPRAEHAGEWILDCAIQYRMSSTANARKMARDRGADPDMDAVFARWAAHATPSLLGDENARALRLAKLCKLGSSTALARLLPVSGLPQERIEQAYTQLLPARPDLLTRCMAEDFCHTIQTLLSHGWQMRLPAPEPSPFMHVQSVEMVHVLLDAGVMPQATIPGEQSLLDRVSTRGLSAATTRSLVEILSTKGKLDDSAASRFHRLSWGLDKKSREQFANEASALGWSVSHRALWPSPVIEFARRALEKPRIVDTQGALEWLSRHPSFGVAQEGQAWSEGAWMTVLHLVNHAPNALRFSALASDVPRLPYFGLLRWLDGFVADQPNASVLFARAASSSMRALSHDKDRSVCKAALADWFEEKEDAPWILSSYRVGFPDSVRNLRAFLGSIPDQDLDAACISRCLSLALRVEGLSNPAEDQLGDWIEKRWDEGHRPLDTPLSRALVMEHIGVFGSALQSKLAQWDLSCSSDQALSVHQRPRL